MFALLSCGGSGGSGGGPSITLSTNSLSFSAADPSASTPPPQVVTLSVSGTVNGTLFIRLVSTGPAVSSITNVSTISNSQGQGTVNVPAPNALGSGTFLATITVSACTTDINCSGPQLPGSPATVNVTYQIGALPDAIAPAVGTTGVGGSTILRGGGFTGATDISFGGVPGTIVSVVSDSEIQADYPALPQGNHAVQIQNAGGAVPFSKSLAIVDAPAYATTSIDYPTPPQTVLGLAYDAAAKALLVGVSDGSTGNILRYAFSGAAWPTTPGSVTLLNLRSFALLFDASRVLAVSDASVTELNPATLAQIRSTPKPPAIGEFLTGIALANDGKALLPTNIPGSGFNGLYLYDYGSGAPSFTLATLSGGFVSFYVAMVGAGPEGRFVNIVQGPLSPNQPFYRYNSSISVLSAGSVGLAHAFAGSGVNPNGLSQSFLSSKIVAHLASGLFNIYDSDFNLIDALPATTAASAITKDASRIYTLDINTGTCKVRIFDATVVPLAEVGTGITLSSCPTAGLSTKVEMLLTPAEDTAFIAGELRIAVVQLQ